MSRNEAAHDPAEHADGQVSVVDFLHTIIGGEDVLIRSTQIRKILRPHALTPVPVGPDHLLGLANIHGQIVCIIDVGRATSLPVQATGQSGSTRFLLLRHPAMHVGIQVDHVLGIKRVPENALPADGLVAKIITDGGPVHVLDCRLLLHEQQAGLSG